MTKIVTLPKDHALHLLPGSPILYGVFKIFQTIEGRVVQWLVTCARKPKVLGSSLVATYVQR